MCSYMSSFTLAGKSTIWGTLQLVLITKDTDTKPLRGANRTPNIDHHVKTLAYNLMNTNRNVIWSQLIAEFKSENRHQNNHL